MAKRKRPKSIEDKIREMKLATAATPETLAHYKRRGPSTLDVLWQKNLLRTGEWDAAQEIREAFETVTRLVSCRTSKSGSVDGYGSYLEMEPNSHSHNEEWPHHALHLKARLAQWWEALEQRGRKEVGWLVYRVVIDGFSLKEIGRQIGHSTKRDVLKLRELIVDGLDCYADATGLKPRKQNA